MFNAPNCPQSRCDGQGKPLQADLWRIRSRYSVAFIHHNIEDDRGRFKTPIMDPFRVAVWYCSYCGQVEAVEDLAAWAYDFASTQFASKLTDLQVKWKRFKLF